MTHGSRYFDMVRWLLADCRIPDDVRAQPAGDKVKAVVHWLIFFRNTETGDAFPHEATIAQILGLSTRTVQRAVKHAVAQHLVAVERTGAGNRYSFPAIERALDRRERREKRTLEAQLPSNCGSPWSERLAKVAKAEWKIRPSVAHIQETIESALAAGVAPGRIVQALKDHPGQLVYAHWVLGDVIKHAGAWPRDRLTDPKAVEAACRAAFGSPESPDDQ